MGPGARPGRGRGAGKKRAGLKEREATVQDHLAWAAGGATLPPHLDAGGPGSLADAQVGEAAGLAGGPLALQPGALAPLAALRKQQQQQQARPEARPPRDEQGLKCIDPSHTAQGARCTVCRPPPSFREINQFKLVGDAGLKNGEKKLRRFIQLTEEWTSEEERLKLADRFKEVKWMRDFCTIVINKDVPALRKPHLLMLAYAWGFKSDIWQKRREKPEKSATNSRGKKRSLTAVQGTHVSSATVAAKRPHGSNLSADASGGLPGLLGLHDAVVTVNNIPKPEDSAPVNRRVVTDVLIPLMKQAVSKALLFAAHPTPTLKEMWTREGSGSGEGPVKPRLERFGFHHTKTQGFIEMTQTVLASLKARQQALKPEEVSVLAWTRIEAITPVETVVTTIQAYLQALVQAPHFDTGASRLFHEAATWGLELCTRCGAFIAQLKFSTLAEYINGCIGLLEVMEVYLMGSKQAVMQKIRIISKTFVEDDGGDATNVDGKFDKTTFEQAIPLVGDESPPQVERADAAAVAARGKGKAPAERPQQVQMAGIDLAQLASITADVVSRDVTRGVTADAPSSAAVAAQAATKAPPTDPDRDSIHDLLASAQTQQVARALQAAKARELNQLQAQQRAVQQQLQQQQQRGAVLTAPAGMRPPQLQQYNQLLALHELLKNSSAPDSFKLLQPGATLAAGPAAATGGPTAELHLAQMVQAAQVRQIQQLVQLQQIQASQAARAQETLAAQVAHPGLYPGLYPPAQQANLQALNAQLGQPAGAAGLPYAQGGDPAAYNALLSTLGLQQQHPPPPE